MNSLESRLPITEFYGYDCRYTERPSILDYPRALTPKYAHSSRKTFIKTFLCFFKNDSLFLNFLISF